MKDKLNHELWPHEKLMQFWADQGWLSDVSSMLEVEVVARNCILALKQVKQKQRKEKESEGKNES